MNCADEFYKTMSKRNSFFIITFFLFLLPAYASNFLEHQVKDGENLFRISRRYNISLEELCRINNLKQDSVIKEGTVLKVPAQNTPAVTDYVVQKGDNLFRIGLKYNITVNRLCTINNFDENVVLYPGKIIKVPDTSASQTEAAPERTVSNPAPVSSSNTAIKAVTPVILESYTIHTMKKGETLYQLSRRYSADIKQIQAANNITDATVLRPGMRIKIPQISTVSRNFIEYSLPLAGRVVPYVKSHYKGILVFSSDANSIVKAVDNGVVSHVDMRAGYGLIVFIKHSNGLVSTYSGFSEIYVKKDMIIKTGQAIGKPGAVSRQTSPGILFSLQDGSKSLNFDMQAGKFYK